MRAHDFPLPLREGVGGRDEVGPVSRPGPLPQAPCRKGRGNV
jgi:hypothetical protein